MAQDDPAVERSPAELRAAFRETCARITAHVDAVETRIRTRFHNPAPSRHTGSARLISDVWRFARGCATGYIAMRKWIGVDSHR
jgi:hypothetical protein